VQYPSFVTLGHWSLSETKCWWIRRLFVFELCRLKMELCTARSHWV